MCGWFHTTGTWGDGFFPRAGVGRFFDAITNVACELCTYLNKEYTMIKTKNQKNKIPSYLTIIKQRRRDLINITTLL